MDEKSEMTAVDFVVDHIVVQVIVARFEGYLKVGEETVSMRLLHPFAPLRGNQVDDLCLQAEQAARQAWEKLNADP